MQNLLSQPDPTLLPAEPDADAALDAVDDVAGAKQVAARFPHVDANRSELEQLVEEMLPDRWQALR